MGQERDDFVEKEYQAILEPENLFPLIVMSAVFSLAIALLAWNWMRP